MPFPWALVKPPNFGYKGTARHPAFNVCIDVKDRFERAVLMQSLELKKYNPKAIRTAIKNLNSMRNETRRAMNFLSGVNYSSFEEDVNFHDFLVFEYDMVRHLRRLVYMLEKEEYWELPVSARNLFWRRNMEREMQARRQCAERAAWILTHRGDVRSEEKYKSLNRGFLDTLLEDLHPSLNRLLKTEDLQLDWKVFIALVGDTQSLRLAKPDDVMGAILERLIKEVNFTIYVEDLFEVVEARQAWEAGVRECPICKEEFSDRWRGVEKVVKTKCGHYMGKDCIIRWHMSAATERDGAPMCPMCRSDLTGDLVDLLPLGIREPAKQWVENYERLVEMDDVIDKYLMEGEQQTYPPEFGRVLNLMQQIRDDEKSIEFAIQQRIHEYITARRLFVRA